MVWKLAHFYRPKPAVSVPFNMERDVQTNSDSREAQTLSEDEKQSRLDRYRKDLDDARREVEDEKQKPLGLYDDMLNLLTWIETPEERLHKNQLAKITIDDIGSGSQKPTLDTTPPGIVGGIAQRVLLALAKAK